MSGISTSGTATQPWQMEAVEMAALIRTGRLSSREAAQSCLGRLDAVNPKINAVTLALHDEAIKAADAADTARARGALLGPLHGVPVTTKCNTDQTGTPNDNGVVAFKDVIAKTDNPVIANMRKAGAIPFARTNTPAFSMRWFTNNDLHGQTYNPYNKDYTCGGSSGGAGAATAVGIGAIAQGNDIGGSIRWPAYCNGIVGIRPSYGRVPAFNETAPPGRPLAAQLMAVQGPLTRTVRDCRLALDVMSRGDIRDNRWVDVPLRGPASNRPLRAAIVPNPPGGPVDPAVSDAVRTAGRHLEAAGYIVEERTPPQFLSLVELWHKIGVVEVFGGLKEKVEKYGDYGIKRVAGMWSKLRPPVDLATFQAAWIERDAAIHAWNMFLEETPVLVMPSGAEAALPLGLDTESEASLERFFTQVGRFMLQLPVLGLPGLSVPVGFNKIGLPVGVQIIAQRYREDLCFDAGEIIESFEGPRAAINPKF